MGVKPRVVLGAALAMGLALPSAATATTMTRQARPGTQRAATSSNITSPLEAHRSASARVPKLDWWECADGLQCAGVDVPLDYDSPWGKTTQLAVARVPAKDPAHKIGALFVNPGGPGGSGVELAAYANRFLSDQILERFDIVGFDPRGIGYSDNLQCFASRKDQKRALTGLETPFPFTAEEEKQTMTSAKALGRACATHGRVLATSMSTAEAARDMDLLRRALKNPKLTYLGFSYGSELGLTYANMYPDRVRAITVDGTIDPVAWAGDTTTASTILDARLKSSEGAYKALREILTRCRFATTAQCPLAGTDVVATFDSIARRLQVDPLTVTEADGKTWRYSYAALIDDVLGELYLVQAPTKIMQIILWLTELLDNETPAARRAEVLKSFLAARKERKQNLLDRVLDETDAKILRGWPARSVPARGFPYDNSDETYLGVICGDGRHPKDVSSWPEATAEMDKKSPYFGRSWGWTTVPCASNTWRAQDEDVYRGPFNKRTVSPVLIIGNYWDPATAYTGAQSAAARTPNARLLSSDNWGHTAYGTSTCISNAIDTYFLKRALPPAGLVCNGDAQPFTEDFPQETSGSLAPDESSSAAGEDKILPPIAPERVLRQIIDNL